MRPTAVVTGANRGLGLEVARRLAATHHVVLGVRRPEEAEDAGLLVPSGTIRALDLSDADSIAAFADSLGPVDILVNNAAILLDGFDLHIVRRTLTVNHAGTLLLTDRLLPRLGLGARVVMVSSGLGELTCLAPALQARFRDPTLDRDGLATLTRAFLSAVERGRWAGQGWPTSAYRVSKVALNAYTRILAREARSLRVNAVCPGWVRTRMGGAHAPISVENGARGILWAANLTADGPSGGFFRDGRPIPW